MKINVAPLLKRPVGAQTDFQVSESPIDPRGENAGLIEAGVSSIDADILATHTNPGAYLEGEARGSVSRQCSRCLNPIETPVLARFAEQYYSAIDVLSGTAKTAPPLDAKTISSDFRIDLTPLLCEELILATPLAPVCRPDCLGLCPVCGRDQNVEPHAHEDEDETLADERWRTLRRLQELHPDR